MPQRVILVRPGQPPGAILRSMPSLEFNRLPLVEVVVRLALATPLPVTLRELTRVHERLKSRFPHVAEPSPMEAAPGGAQPLLTFGPIRAAIYSGHESGLLYTLQPTMVAFRWRGGTKDAAPYPRFTRLTDELWRCLEDTEAVIGRPLAFDVANMSYIDFVQTNDHKPLETVGKYFTAERWPGFLARASQFESQNVSWAEGEVEHRLIFERGVVQHDHERNNGCLITTVAGMRFEPRERPSDEVQLLHDALIKLFEETLSDEAKEEWGYVGQV